MPDIEKHAPGSFCWIELATSDQNSAKSFYTALFNWTANDSPMAPGEFYTIFQLRGRAAAGGYTLMPDQRSQGVPPNWLLYVCVENADESASRAASLGGKILRGAFDVFGFGRMAVLQDPAGAVFAVWQPLQHAGIGVQEDPGSFCWADLSLPDRNAAIPFYEGLFGWKITPGEGKENDASVYLHIKNGEQLIGGVPSASQRDPNAPPHWLIYFAVEDVFASADKAKAVGAAIYFPPTKMEHVGDLSVLADPQGAVFALFTLEKKEAA